MLAASPSYTKKVLAAGGSGDPARYVHGRVDPNDDGRVEIFVFVMGSTFFGTGGCDLMLFSEGKGRYTLVKDLPISRPPVIVSPKKTRG